MDADQISQLLMTMPLILCPCVLVVILWGIVFVIIKLIRNHLHSKEVAKADKSKWVETTGLVVDSLEIMHRDYSAGGPPFIGTIKIGYFVNNKSYFIEEEYFGEWPGKNFQVPIIYNPYNPKDAVTGSHKDYK